MFIVWIIVLQHKQESVCTQVYLVAIDPFALSAPPLPAQIQNMPPHRAQNMYLMGVKPVKIMNNNALNFNLNIYLSAMCVPMIIVWRLSFNLGVCDQNKQFKAYFNVF